MPNSQLLLQQTGAPAIGVMYEAEGVCSAGLEAATEPEQTGHFALSVQQEDVLLPTQQPAKTRQQLAGPAQIAIVYIQHNAAAAAAGGGSGGGDLVHITKELLFGQLASCDRVVLVCRVYDPSLLGCPIRVL